MEGEKVDQPCEESHSTVVRLINVACVDGVDKMRLLLRHGANSNEIVHLRDRFGLMGCTNLIGYAQWLLQERVPIRATRTRQYLQDMMEVLRSHGQTAQTA